MSSIKDLEVRINKKGKTRGRPSKVEIHMSKMMTEICKSDAFQKEMNEYINDATLYGTGIFNTNKALNNKL